MIDPFSQEEIPEILFKYRNFTLDNNRNKSHFDDLINGEFFFSSPRNFNDPFDCDIPINYQEFTDNPKSIERYVKMGMEKFPEYFKDARFPNVVKEVLAANTLTNIEFINKHTADMQEDLKNAVGIYSTSAKNDSLLMWSHYSNSHTGFCFGIDTNQLMENLTVESIGKVKYATQYPLISPLDEGLDQLRKQLLYKSDGWNYEKEYRILLMHRANKSVRITLNCINSIYLGLNISIENTERFLSLRSSIFTKTKFYQMQKSPKEFRIISKEI